MSEWQPIETAPKDGTQIDLWLQVYTSARSMGFSDSFRVTAAWWDGATKQWVHTEGAEAHPLYADYITHWMPQPEPPVTK